ncbi:DUF3461 family protein [Granulosicoccus antarcticus]|uniref:Uncharacterized protein n=1 Tax=Granulosicoccus antarcticus IMCC3135 TaxID=1192854 RepID=A0A2Z2NZ47_9GAMM|nr:DUF3461 family protein [Granulosicoccus antarcticus]ASJ72404.1 hypothetical protein IMCC3135_11570 [Granulosicoccus antarcticus IMCC3135]
MSANLAEKIADYPALAEMGIVRFHEISHYSLRQDGADKDVLRVIYKRAKGSFLPHTRKYKFGRSMKTVIADGGTSRMEHTYEISPFLLKAVAELDSLVEINQHDTSKVTSTDLKADLLAEMNELKLLVSGSATPEGQSAVNAKLDSVRKHIEAL